MAMADLPLHHIIVTGGTGYIGSRLVELALVRGCKVTLLGRRSGECAARHVAWTLGEPMPRDALDDRFSTETQALVHLAHDWAADAYYNVEGTKLLFDGARQAGLAARIFVSSQSAQKEALNRYGRLKWATEQALPADVSLRVGLVYGGPRVAMYGLLHRITALPLLPMVDPHRCVQPIHRDEVAEGIFAAIDRRLTGVFALAGPHPMSFGDVLRTLARVCRGRNLPIVPVPLRLALFGCAVTACMPIIPTINRERVLGLAGTEPMPAEDDLAILGITVMPMAQGLAQEASGRRALLGEARALLRHAGGIAPETVLLKRYARAFADGAIAYPRYLAGWREPFGTTSLLGNRMRVAARIAETSPRVEAAQAGHQGRGSQLRRLASLAWILVIEVLRVPTRLVATMRAT